MSDPRDNLCILVHNGPVIRTLFEDAITRLAVPQLAIDEHLRYLEIFMNDKILILFRGGCLHASCSACPKWIRSKLWRLASQSLCSLCFGSRHSADLNNFALIVRSPYMTSSL
jgi:hypothetical protein